MNSASFVGRLHECVTEGRTKEGPTMQIRTLAEAISHYGREAYLPQSRKMVRTPVM